MAQITGANTLFQSSSPKGFYLDQGASTIFVHLGTFNPTTKTSVQIVFNIATAAMIKD
jgi:hypothetical protein